MNLDYLYSKVYSSLDQSDNQETEFYVEESKSSLE